MNDPATQESRHYFRTFIEKPLLGLLDGGRIMPVEGVDHDLARLLDRSGGIDYLHDHPEHGLTGIALRIQYDRNYESFTIRYRRESGRTTEHEKLARALTCGGIAPMLSVQAYIDRRTDSFIAGAVVRTDDLLDCIRLGKSQIQSTDLSGRAVFHVVYWTVLQHVEPKIWFHRFGPNY